MVLRSSGKVQVRVVPSSVDDHRNREGAIQRALLRSKQCGKCAQDFSEQNLQSLITVWYRVRCEWAVLEVRDRRLD
jgi:hypothetical protein